MKRRVLFACLAFWSATSGAFEQKDWIRVPVTTAVKPDRLVDPAVTVAQVRAATNKNVTVGAWVGPDGRVFGKPKVVGEGDSKLRAAAVHAFSASKFIGVQANDANCSSVFQETFVEYRFSDVDERVHVDARLFTAEEGAVRASSKKLLEKWESKVDKLFHFQAFEEGDSGVAVKHRVRPKYSKDALLEGIYVDFDLVAHFVVGADGSVSNILVIDDDMPSYDMNVNVAEAIEQWQFAPMMKNGMAVPRKACQRLSFTSRAPA